MSWEDEAPSVKQIGMIKALRYKLCGMWGSGHGTSELMDLIRSKKNASEMIHWLQDNLNEDITQLGLDERMQRKQRLWHESEEKLRMMKGGKDARD